MKRYYVETIVDVNDGRHSEHKYECESFDFRKNWTGQCIRLEDVNTYKEGKRKVIRRQMSRGLYVPIEKMGHWNYFKVTVYLNETKEVVKTWEE